MTQYIPLNSQQHAQLKLQQGLDWSAIATQRQCTVNAEEYAAASSSAPLFFVKNMHNGLMQSIALFGLAPDENLLVSADDSSMIAYTPTSLRLLPFQYQSDPQDSSRLQSCIDRQSTLLSETTGEPLYDEKGKDTPLLQQISDNLNTQLQAEMATHRFITLLLEHKLIQELKITIKHGKGETVNMAGLYTIDETALNALAQETQLNFLKQGFYPPIHAMLASLTQMNRLIQQYNKRYPGQPITSIDIATVGQD